MESGYWITHEIICGVENSMNADYVLDISSQAIKVAMLLSAPMLGGALLVGFSISLFQALTQINEQTLAIIPKIVAIFLVMILSGPWILQTMTDFTRTLYLEIPLLVLQ